MRLLGPFVVVLTVVLFASGIALLYVTGQLRGNIYFVHRASFILWFGAMTIHVLGHLLDTAELAPRDWYGRARRDIKGASARQWLLIASLVAGVLLASLVVSRVNWFWSTAQPGQQHALRTNPPPIRADSGLGRQELA